MLNKLENFFWKKLFIKKNALCQEWYTFIDVLVKIKTKKDIIFTTPEHPFYVNGQYILAGFLNTNMKLTDFEGKEVEILEIEIIKYQKKTESL